MDNITGNAVEGKNFLSTRLFLVDELRNNLQKTSLIIDAPRRFGKTSIVKELISQENKKANDREFDILFWDLEGVQTINEFCLTIFDRLLELDSVKKKINQFQVVMGDLWNAISDRIGKVKAPGIEFEIRSKTKNYDFSQWKEKIEPLIGEINSSSNRFTILVFDEFPDMLLNLKKDENYALAVDSLMAWLRSLRQNVITDNKLNFVFCGSINLKETLKSLGISKRINDLETMTIPPMSSVEAELLIRSLMATANINITDSGIAFIVNKSTDGPPYYAQLIFQALRQTYQKNFSSEQVKSIYEGLINDNHDLNHFHTRLEEYLPGEIQKQCSKNILSHLSAEPMEENALIGYMSETEAEVFAETLSRLIHEGYILRDMRIGGRVRFVSPLLQDWWMKKHGGNK